MNQLNKTTIISALIEQLTEETNPVDIRTDYITKYEQPDKITSNKTENEFIPDLEIIYDDAIHIFEIELDEKISIKKLKLFSSYCKSKNGNLYLVVPEWIKSVAVEKLEKSDIDLDIVEFKQNG